MSPTAGRERTPARAAPVWAVVCARELRDLWIGGKALYLILVYCVLLGILAYLLSSNVELNLLPLREMILEVVKTAVAAGVGMCLIVGADAVSGERERRTLEGLLLAPAGHRQIVLGKFLASLSPWPVAMALVVPYALVLSHGDAALGPALFWGAVSGTLLAVAFAGLAMLVSVWSNSNKTSLLVSLAIYLLLLLPAVAGLMSVQRSEQAQRRADAEQWANPVAAASRALYERVLREATPAAAGAWLVTPGLFAVATPVLLLGFAGRRLPVTAGADGTGSGRRPRQAPRPAARPAAAPRDPRDDELGRAALRGPATATRGGRSEPGAAAPAWWVVGAREMRELWIGGKALVLLLAYTAVVGIAAFVSVSNSQLDLIPPKEMVFTLLQTSMYVGILMGVVIGADTLSGARERALLEPLLLTPASRRQIIVGKFLAAMSPWPAALAVSIPCMAVLAQGDAVLGPALLWFAFVGTLLVVGYTGLAMLVSFWCNSNRTSLAANLTVYFLFLLPALLPGRAQKGLVGKFFQRANPLAAADEFLEKIVVNNRTLHAFGSWLKAPVVLPVLVLAVLFLFAGPRLNLEAGRARIARMRGRLAPVST